MKYHWKAPQFHTDQIVRFTDSWGQDRTGSVMSVETTYDTDGCSGHVYNIYVEGARLKRHLYYASEDVIEEQAKAE